MAHERAPKLDAHTPLTPRRTWRLLVHRVVASIRWFRGPRYWAARVARLERGAASVIESRARAIPGVLIAHVTPSIDGSATISISYDARRASVDAIVAVIEPLAPGLELIETAGSRSAHPEDQCVC